MTLSSRRWGFPGLIAPASLKHELTGREKAHFGCFPGLIAPASLKLAISSCLVALMFCFPGLIAPASLKRQRGRASGQERGLVFRG